MTMVALVLTLIALAGIGYQLAAAWQTSQMLSATPLPPPGAVAVTILKPLYGAEPQLSANLETFLVQGRPGAVQLLCGVQRADDPAIAVVTALQARHGEAVTLVIDATRHGSNAKISNLANMIGAARHDTLILSDSDIVIDRHYADRVLAALAAPGVGAVTCLYHGRGDAGCWSRIAAMGIGFGFLPSVVVGLATGRARPCMGSTIALRRETLAGIGGFAAFADVLADDHAIGAAVRALGLRVAVPGFTVGHACAERSFAELVRHELRWHRTIRLLDPLGYAGHGLVNPLPFALLALAARPDGAAAGLIAAALLSRVVLAWRVMAVTGTKPGPLLWLPLRDLIDAGLFVTCYTTRSVDWRGSRFDVARDGRMAESGGA